MMMMQRRRWVTVQLIIGVSSLLLLSCGDNATAWLLSNNKISNGQHHWNHHNNHHLRKHNEIPFSSSSILSSRRPFLSSNSRSTTRYFYRSPDKESFNSSDVTSDNLLLDQQQEQQTDNEISSPSSSYQGTLGDIMSPRTGNDKMMFQDGLVTSEEYSIAKTFGITKPLDRMAITANGNLQRLFSSYYDAPVEVIVDYCRKINEEKDEGDGCYWDRCVHLRVWNTTFCTAISKVFVHDHECQRLVDSGQVGIGQLFRYLNVLPEFELQNAGRNTNSDGFWRQYTLTSPMVTCVIHESFCPNVWELKPEEQ